jgi:spermidine synthase
MQHTSHFFQLCIVFCTLFTQNFITAHPLSEYRMLSMESVNLENTHYSEKRDHLGQHLVIDLFGCNPEKISIVESVEQVMVAAANAAKATIVAQKFHQFSPGGVSGALILAESHLAIHTWPEVQGYCAIDIFTCGATDNFAALEVLKTGFGAQGYVVVEIERGKQRSDLVSNATGSVFFRENLDPLNGFQATVAIKELLESVESEFQKIEMYETTAFGKMLAIDGVIQLTEYDNAAYHEMITHVPLQTHKNPRKVLIIGGGDGGALAEVVKYPNIEEIVICDIDASVAAVTTKYFPAFAAAYQDPRVRPIYQDGSTFITSFKDYFDVIIVDGPDFYGHAAAFARETFYKNISDALKEDGLMVIQAESLFYDRAFIADLYKQAEGIFPIVKYYNTLVPSYPSGSIGFILGSKEYNPLKKKKNKKAKKDEHNSAENESSFLPKSLEFYTPEVHRASFALPAFLKRLLELPNN